VFEETTPSFLFLSFHFVFFISSFCHYLQCLFLCVSLSQLLELNTDVRINKYITQWSSEETLRILWNPKVHYHLHKRPPLLPFLAHISPVHTSDLPICLSSSLLPKTFRQKQFMKLSSLPCVLHSPLISSSLILSYFYVWCRIQIMKLLSVPFSYSTHQFNRLISSADIPISTLFCSSFNPIDTLHTPIK
jgi:hypothetical protein